MTREQAINYLKSSGMSQEQIKSVTDAFTCEDCISRQAVIIQLSHNKNGNDDCDVIIQKDIETIKALSPVTQQPKTGHWKEVYAETDYCNGWIEFSCENCEYQHGLESGEYGWSYGDPIPWKYCPICGARMVEPQESEDKE